MKNAAERVGKVLICSAVYDSKVHLAYHTSIVTTLVMFESTVCGYLWHF